MFRLIGTLFWLAFKLVALGVKLLVLPLKVIAAIGRFLSWGRAGLMSGLVFFAAAMGIAWGIKEAAEQAAKNPRPEYEPVS
jgi:F0F1-type ATP synthase membrane subunit c/vacuolar-type H+-ATPase subunit K